RAVHASCLDKHGRTYVVAAVHVGDQLVQQIPLVGDALRSQVPEVMMGIADGNLRLQGRFLGEGQPVIASVWHNGPPWQDARRMPSTGTQVTRGDAPQWCVSLPWCCTTA